MIRLPYIAAAAGERRESLACVLLSIVFASENAVRGNKVSNKLRCQGNNSRKIGVYMHTKRHKDMQI